MFQLLELIENEEDREFCRKLYCQYRNALYREAYQILRNSADAEDAVQECFAAVAKNIEKVSRENCHKAWNYIVTILRNKAFNAYNKRNREYGMEPDMIEKKMLQAEGDGEIFELSDGGNMSELIGRMKYPYKEVLFLQYYNELTYKEIADVFETTPDNVRHISYRAKKKLEGELKKGKLL